MDYTTHYINIVVRLNSFVGSSELQKDALKRKLELNKALHNAKLIVRIKLAVNFYGRCTHSILKGYYLFKCFLEKMPKKLSTSTLLQ